MKAISSQDAKEFVQSQREQECARCSRIQFIKEKIRFKDVKEFLVCSGLHYNTSDGEASGITHNQYTLVREAAYKLGGGRVRRFVIRIVSCDNGEHYLDAFNVGDAGWKEIEECWDTGRWWAWAEVPPEQR